ncbi:MAG: hypothetical protein ACWA6Y_02590 [Polaromonas sp.]
MQRRTLLVLGLASAAALTAAGGAALWLPPGLRADGTLSPAGKRVMAAAGQALLDSSLPAGFEARRQALDGWLGRVDGLVGALAPHAQAELSQLLALLDTAAGRRLLAGLEAPWPQAPVNQVQQALQGMRLSALAVRQQAYGALHDITASAYFADAATWPLLGYPGPQRI